MANHAFMDSGRPEILGSEVRAHTSGTHTHINMVDEVGVHVCITKTSPCVKLCKMPPGA